MGEGVVSVVLPIYNVEKYLNRCVKSVINQSYQNLEIILVDDGSPDNCPALCDEWAKKDNRIKVVHKKNAGLGYARNTGIENATGEYICFVDSDDYIALDAIEKAYRSGKESNADIVYYGHSVVDSNGRVVRVFKPEMVKLVYTGTEVTEMFFPELISPDYSKNKKMNLMLSACTALFSMKMVNDTNWRFVSEREIISEDAYSLTKLFGSVACVAVVPEAYYFYCQNDTSLTRTYRKDRYEKIKDFYDKVILLCQDLVLPETVKTRFASVYLSFVIAALKMIVSSEESIPKKMRRIQAIENDVHLKAVLCKVNPQIESKSRNMICKALLRKQTILCYFMLYFKCKRT